MVIVSDVKACRTFRDGVTGAALDLLDAQRGGKHIAQGVAKSVVIISGSCFVLLSQQPFPHFFKLHVQSVAAFLVACMSKSLPESTRKFIIRDKLLKSTLGGDGIPF